MTVGVALKCRDSVVLACDSQATGGYKDLTTKLEQLDGYHGALFAGSVLVSKDILDRVKTYLKTEDNPDSRKIAYMTSDVMATLYREYAKKLGGSGMQDVIGLSNGISSQILIGGRDENEGPQIWEVASPGVFGPIDNYRPIGSGGPFAATILKSEFFKDMHSDHGHFLATRAVVSASQMDPYVGEGFAMAAIFRPPNGYRDISNSLETRYRPLVERINTLRHDLDLILMGDTYEQEDSLARLLDTLGVFGIGSEKLGTLSERAYRLRRQEESLREERLKDQQPREQDDA